MAVASPYSIAAESDTFDLANLDESHLISSFIYLSEISDSQVTEFVNATLEIKRDRLIPNIQSSFSESTSG